jgi:streptogramin lyase
VKAYAADRDTQIEGVPKGATLEQFDAQAQGEIEVVRGEIVARRLDSEQRLVMVFRAPGGDKPEAPQGRPEGNMLTAQLGGQARLARGEDLRGLKRRSDAREPREMR